MIPIKKISSQYFKWEVFDFLKDLTVIIIIVLVIRTFLVMPFQINGQSMDTSYYDWEFILVDRLSYLIGEPNRWDVIVFKPEVSDDKEYFLKRIIGIGGDKIKIENGEVYRSNGGIGEYVLLDEAYLNDSNKWATYVGSSRDTVEYTIPEGQYFVMWDNRNHSTDARQCFSSCVYAGATHFIPKKNITGHLFIDLWYFNFKTFSFIHPKSGIETFPKFLNTQKTYEY